VNPFTVSTTISVPREQVFEYLADIANHAEFTDHYMVDWHLTREDPYGQGAGARFRIKAPLRRFAWAGSALFYAGFAWVAIGMIFGSDRQGNSDQMAHEWTAWLLGQPFRRWAVGAVGLGFLMTGAGVAVRGLQAKFKRQIEANKQKREVVTALGVAGFVARGFVFAMTCITATPADAADARSTTAGRWRPLQIRTAPRQPKAFPHLAAAAWRL